MSPLNDFIADHKEDYKLDNEYALDDDSENESVTPAFPTNRDTSHTGPSRERPGSVLRGRPGSSIATSEHQKPRQGSITSHIEQLGDFLRGRRGSSIAASEGQKPRQGSTTSNINLGAVASTSLHASGTNDSEYAMPSLLKTDHAPAATRKMSRTTQLINEETHTPGHAIAIPEPSYSFKRDVTVALDAIPPTPATEIEAFEIEEVPDHRATGKIASWRGGIILGTACFAQLVDNIWMTSINIAVPHIAEEFNLHDGSQSWLVSAYTLTFGGFLLLAGVLSDRLGRRAMFTAGMLWMMAASIACGVSRTGVQCIVFRALQGLGAAASVPSAIGVLSNFFVGNEKHRALSMFGAAGAVGFVVGLILGGILSGTLGWRYVFYINAPIICILAITGAGLGTSGIVLMTFALSQSEVSGWNKPIVVVTLIVSILVLLGFSWTERKVPNPIMPTYLWKLPSFAGIWCAGFLLYCWWASVVYYLSLIAQEVLFLTPLNTGLYLIPMGAWGFVVSIVTGRAVERFELKPLLVAGFFISVVGTLPAAFVKTGDLFWPLVFPTAIICVTGISIAYNVASIALVSAVPPVAKSLAGGLINTAFQIGSGFGLAITSLVYENVLQKQLNPSDPSSLMKGYQAALFTSCGLVGGSLILSIFTVRNGQQTVSSGMMVH
ncbi:MFS general substrate transporter [Lentinula boryana]|uniref:MFS general substrate transporter n=1 Tax=Lentinula boryana TaxID=40481 RepID=A0ABQ8Q8M1_9AGAR|nr:MFS general substrate transporter [Lentinula boryana]